MKSSIVVILMTVFLALAPSVFASGKKEVKSSVSFHLESDGNDNPRMISEMVHNGKKRYFRRLPEINTKDIVSFNPFPSEINDSYGIVFRLTPVATGRLAAVTASNQGKYLMAQINGRLVDGVLIDKEINDGFVVIWKGATLGDIQLLDQDKPRLGEEGKKKKNNICSR
ncbi:MAG: hypothetical protein HC845_05625 [Akkermansiaceae bacterium]|nr:hypothetical protein [Akkermansiaceae bacterium]